jgi:PIN domain nuclease of toxin-antitoxin system
MRLMLDTCAIIDLLTDMETLGKGAMALIDDPENVLFASAESMRELVVHFNNKRLLNRYFKTSTDVLKAVETELDIEFLPVRRNVGYQYSRLTINEAEDHRDPSDHIIISHAITERMSLLSSDTRFPFYREQGLDLIEY